jgi:hypothetical protein
MAQCPESRAQRRFSRCLPDPAKQQRTLSDGRPVQTSVCAGDQRLETCVGTQCNATRLNSSHHSKRNTTARAPLTVRFASCTRCSSHAVLDVNCESASSCVLSKSVRPALACANFTGGSDQVLDFADLTASSGDLVGRVGDVQPHIQVGASIDLLEQIVRTDTRANTQIQARGGDSQRTFGGLEFAFGVQMNA